MIDQVFQLLTEKEQDIMAKRHGLYGHKKHTLEKIGEEYDVTRERIRQIQNSCIKKIWSRRESVEGLSQLLSDAYMFLVDSGGFMDEEGMKNYLDEPHSDFEFLPLVHPEIVYKKETPINTAYYILKGVDTKIVNNLSDSVYELLEKKGEAMSTEELRLDLMTYTALKIDKRFIVFKDKWGLKKWRHINPKSIRDKINYIFNEIKEPSHFSSVYKAVLSLGKKVTLQAVHNELIRHPEFVLVGRGIYALKEWGFAEGTVAHVIKGVLNETKGMEKKKIVKEVLKERDVKIETISHNLQNNPAFERVGRAVYKFNKDLWDPPVRGRGKA